MAVYLLEFTEPVRGKTHTIGCSHSMIRLPDRLAEHRRGEGSTLTRAARHAGADWSLVRVWPDAGFEYEHKLKHAGTSYNRYCPWCSPGTRAGSAYPSIVGPELRALDLDGEPMRPVMPKRWLRFDDGEWRER